MEAAVGFVVAHGDPVERARLHRLRTGAEVPPEILENAEIGQTADGGWPAVWAGEIPSVDATCFRLGELDDLGALGRPAARRALDWLAVRQQPDGTWEENPALADVAPPWATPGDPDAAYYLTANAVFWLTVAGLDARAAGPLDHRVGGVYAGVVHGGAQAIADRLRPDGTWPSYLIAGGLAAAVLYRQQMFQPWARIESVLLNRLRDLSAAELAWLTAALRRVDVPIDDRFIVAARRRLADTQRSDGGWDNDDGDRFAVHTALAAIRGCR
ncbi:prenyltransferase/squalene oxidase repeat-containing protein [Plantactinospora sp. KBS50]|uniref:prenyltransferase/squalene oxidase repeat-containing protein n=1 Tax=Plantactinospora sp. KBS50 TaxID=2024580 RepID=UPI001E595396|nr:prenyltransferase/squalene oxidase repeat-containing protein [Plantactinospora sp. KBS50]